MNNGKIRGAKDQACHIYGITMQEYFKEYRERDSFKHWFIFT